MPSLENRGAASNTPIRCIYWNVRSISGKKNVKHLQHYINKKQVDLLFLSETWQRNGQPLPELLGYNLISCMSDQTGGRGGVACYFKKDHSPYISCYKNDPQGHYFWLRIDKALGFESDIFAAVCYFPPTNSTAYRGRDRLERNFPYTSLNNDITSFTKTPSSCDFFVVGDFNSRTGDTQAPGAHRHGLSREWADKKINKFGLSLLDLCDKNDLIICNGVTQVWPKSGGTTCRSKSVVDYILTPVSRARYLVKEIQILPLEKKSDHNAMNFTLRRPRPSQALPSPDGVIQASKAHPTQASVGNEARHQSSVQPLMGTVALKASNESLSQISSSFFTSAQEIKPEVKESQNALEVLVNANKIGSKQNGEKKWEQNSPKSVILSSDEWESRSSNRGSHLEEPGTGLSIAPEWEKFDRTNSNKLTGSLHEVTTPDTQASHYSQTLVARSVKCEPYSPAEFNVDAWFAEITCCLLNKIVANGLSQQDRHRKPTRMEAHPIFPTDKKGYMSRNFDALIKQANTKNYTNNNKIDMGLGLKDYWNRNLPEVSIHKPVLLLDKRELMTVNSRPATVASPGLVHVARLYVRADTSCRGQSRDGPRMTMSGTWRAKGQKMGPGYRCTCMCPRGHSRDLQIDHPWKSDTFTRAMTVVESSKFSTLLKNLKSTYDSGKLWKSITQFKIARKIVNAIR